MEKAETETLSNAQLNKAQKRFDWLLTFLICRFKFVHHILGMMVKTVRYDIPTMGVRVLDTGRFELVWNPVFFESLSDEEATFVLYHEVLHLVLHHCTKRKGDLLNHSLWNIAHDLAVNELIPEDSGCKYPRYKDGNILIQLVSEYNKNPMFKDIEERQTAEWYFQYLKSKLPKIDVSVLGKGKEIDDHSGWKEHEIADERIRAKIREIDANNGWGDMPETMRETIRAAQIKRINWKALMITWFGNQACKDKISTRKRPNRKTGYMHPGYRKDYIDRWLIVADTSGSIDKDLLAQWGGVVNQIAEDIPIDFAQCDCAITQKPKPFERRMLNIEFTGRGGTSFGPIMELVDKMGYKGVSILTDGEASAPSKPKQARVLWVMPAGKKAPVDWGQRVYLEL